MIKIQIVKDGVKGADDGATVRAYPKDGGPGKDGVYVVSDALGEVMIEAGEAKEIVEKKMTATERLAAKNAEAEKLAADKAAADKAAADKAAKPVGGLPPIPGK